MLKVYGKIKELRIARGWSQEQLAQKVGYADKSMISRIENGKIELTLPQLEEFAKVFGVPSKDLVGPVGEEEETDESYYLDDYSREMVRFLKENPEYKVAFDAARKLPPDDLLAIVTIMNKNKGVQ